MTTLHIMRGLPGSGKTHKARELLTTFGAGVRINRDDLRAMCHNGKWSKGNETYIVAAEEALATLALNNGVGHIIIDNTNLREHTFNRWVDWAKSHTGAGPKIHDLRGVPMKECIERDCERLEPVGPGVICGMAAEAGIFPWTGKPVVVCDIDGTVADLTHRLGFITKIPKDYAQFYKLVNFDTPIWSVISQLSERAKTHDIVMVSGRPNSCGVATWKWLKRYAVPFKGLFMRNTGDYRPDPVVKQEILKRFLPKDRIVQVFDDRPSVIKMWRENGLNVTEVNTEHWNGRE